MASSKPPQSIGGAATTPLLRRNGLQTSCEPCRKSKHRCDHVRPICRRCTSRGIAEKCNYHPAPMRGLPPQQNRRKRMRPMGSPIAMTSTESTTTLSATSQKRMKHVDQVLSPSITTSDSRTFLSTTHTIDQAPSLSTTYPASGTIPSAETARRPPRPDSPDRDVGFLGSTAFNAIFTENQEHIQQIVSPNMNEADANRNCVQAHDQVAAASRRSLQRWCSKDALFVLEVLSDFPHLKEIADRWDDFMKGCCILGPWLQDCQRSIGRDLFDKYDLAKHEVVVQVAEFLQANMEAPLRMPKDVRFCDFTSHYTGGKLSWEAIGVFLIACGYSLMCLNCDDKVLDFVGHSEQDKQRLLLRLLEASDACVSFCNETVRNTDLSFWLMIENSTYASQVLGDAHYSVWRRLGDLSTAFFARGLHATAETSGLPLWLREVRRRGLGIAYALDKVFCAFVGRPPRISKRYCKIELPLDLQYDELALEDSELAEVVSKLDVNGWNYQVDPGKQRASASLRLFIQDAFNREDVLELCLGPPQDNLREKAKDIIRRSKNQYENSPFSVQYSPDIWLTRSSETSFQVLREYVDNTYNEFMLRRLLVRRLEEDPSELVILAHTILSTIIEMRNLRGVQSTSMYLCWTIVLNGLPAAAVLALELLQLNVRTVSHARIKQDLCVFISFLKWVHVPGEGNYSLADRGRKTLQLIMDKVLATDVPPSEHQDQRRGEAATSSNEPAGPIDDLGVYDFSWLDASHFDQEFWDSLNSIELPTVA